MARHLAALAHFFDVVSRTPVLSPPPASIVFILIPIAPPLGLFVTEPGTHFISRTPEESPRPLVSFPPNAMFVIHVVITRHFNPPSCLFLFSCRFYPRRRTSSPIRILVRPF